VPENYELSEAQKAVLEEYVKAQDDFMSTVNYYVYTDPTISTLLESEIKKYHEGKQSATETVNALQHAAELYLNEY